MSEAALQFRQQCSRGSVRMARCGLVAECQEFGDDDCQSMILNNELVGYEGACKHEVWGKKWRGFDVDMLGEVAPNHQQVGCLVRPRRHWIGQG